MKGPGLRLELDVRRIWRCSKCGRTVRTQGQVTAQRCSCTSDPVQWMNLELAAKKEPFRAPVREHLPEAWEVEESTAPPIAPPAAAESPAILEHPAAEIPPPSPEPPTADPAPVVVTESFIVEIVESVAEAPAPDPDVPPPDAFGAGVEDPPRNPAET